MALATNDEVLRSFDEMEHRDIIHQIVFDAYGRRMATCSSDMFVCIWDREDSGKWIKTSSWKMHGGPVWRVAWAHPEFGQVLATASNDRSVFIWEESIGTFPTKWAKKASFADSRTTVTDIKFAPHHLGLQLATTSTQGIVRIYEAPDITDLSQWSLLHEILPFYFRCSSISWSCNEGLRPLMAVGCDDIDSPSHERLALYELNYNIRKWQIVPSTKLDQPRGVNDVSFSPSVTMMGHLLAVACGDVNLYNISMRGRSQSSSQPTTYLVQKIAVLADVYKVWRMSWNVTGNTISLCTEDGSIRVWKSMYMDEWKLVSTTTPQEKIEESKESISPKKMKKVRTTNPPNVAYY